MRSGKEIKQQKLYDGHSLAVSLGRVFGHVFNDVLWIFLQAYYHMVNTTTMDCFSLLCHCTSCLAMGGEEQQQQHYTTHHTSYFRMTRVFILRLMACFFNTE